jgi:hypothetical protein
LQDPPKFTQIGIFGLKICLWQPWKKDKFIFRQSLQQNEIQLKALRPEWLNQPEG